MATLFSNTQEKNEITIFGNTVDVNAENLKNLKKAETSEKALEEIQTERFYDTLRSYYSHREGDYSFYQMSHADLLEYFYNDRSWRNHNTVSMGMDMSNAMSDTPDRLKEFAYIQQTYEKLPSFWNDPNRSFGSWLVDNGGAMILDPVNLIGFGIGGQAGKQAYRQALKQAIKGKMAKELNKRAFIEVSKNASKQGLGQAVVKGALYEGYIGAGVGAAQDAMLQNTAIKTGIQTEWDLKQLGISTAAGFGFGTVFGAGFTGAGFKLSTRKMKNNSIKNLEDLHNYGRSEITGKRLFSDLITVKEKKSFYKNLKKTEIDEIEYKSKLHGDNIDEQIKNLRDTVIDGSSKPPKEILNYTKYNPKANAIYLKNLADRAHADGSLTIEKISNQEAIKMAEILGMDGDALIKLGKSRAVKDRRLFVEILAHGDHLSKQADDIVKLGNQLHRVDLTVKERANIKKELDIRNQIAHDTLINHKKITENVARAQQIQTVNKESIRASELILNPEDPRMKNLKETNSEEFYKALSKLDTDEQVIVGLQHAHKVGNWDLAAEFVNNNLLSSPDTHILNIVSGLVQTQYKPFVMLLRAANLAPQNKQRAGQLAIEAFDTYIHQYVYTYHALQRALKSFWIGRGLLDSKQMKYDSNIRQGQLQRFINASGELLTQPLGILGTGIQKGIVNPIAFTTSVPLRVLSAGDEFLKTMMFKARRTSQIHTQLRKENDSKIWSGYFKDKDARKAYKKRFKEIEAEYEKFTGEAIPTADINPKAPIAEVNRLQVNDPLQYAREGSYTQSAYSENPITGKTEGGMTGGILSWTNRHRWSRALGLHFINTPANLLKWNAEQIPLLRRLLVHTRHMLAKGKDGKYLNPEAAAEANARMQAGMMLWTSAYFAVMAGKITGGGSRDWRENKERENTTGWQPYSYKTQDGRYVSLNRLDPLMMPFFIMADIMDTLNDFLKHNEDLPQEAENTLLELSMGVLASLTRNITSKFYAKNILETAAFLLSDDFMKSRAPDRIGTSILARGIYKWFPLSGALRYFNRVDADVQYELFTMSDRMKQLNPFIGKDSIMPRRNIFGEKIDRKNGWLFGLGGQTGLWSTPFAMTEWKNPFISKFFENRDFNYRAPSPVDRKSQLDLRTIRNEKTGQTAYDRWRELTGEVTIKYKGKNYTLKRLIEELIMDKNSVLYDMPDGLVAGKDYKQSVILKYVHAAEKLAWAKMIKEYPIVIRTINERGAFKILKFKEQREKKKKNILFQ